MTEKEQKHMRAKAWCYDNKATEEQMISAWGNALKAKNPIIKNLDSRGYEWWWLPEHLLQQLLKMYSDESGGV